MWIENSEGSRVWVQAENDSSGDESQESRQQNSFRTKYNNKTFDTWNTTDQDADVSYGLRPDPKGRKDGKGDPYIGVFARKAVPGEALQPGEVLGTGATAGEVLHVFSPDEWSARVASNGGDSFFDKAVGKAIQGTVTAAFAAGGGALAAEFGAPAIVGKGLVNTTIGGLTGGPAGAVTGAVSTGLTAVNPDIVNSAVAATGIPAEVLKPIIAGVEGGTLSKAVGGDFTTGAVDSATKTVGTGLIDSVSSGGDKNPSDVQVKPFVDPGQGVSTPLEPPVTNDVVAAADTGTTTDVTAPTTGTNNTDVDTPSGVTVTPYVDPGNGPSVPLEPAVPFSPADTSGKPQVVTNRPGTPTTPTTPTVAQTGTHDFSGHVTFDANGHLQLRGVDDLWAVDPATGRQILAGVGYRPGLIHT